MVQVMLQLPGSNYQLPVNIPAETILPALTKYLPKLPPATVAVTTGSSGIILKQEAQKVDAGLVWMSLINGTFYDSSDHLGPRVMHSGCRHPLNTI